MDVLSHVRAVEDWRGVLAFTFTLGFFINFIVETVYTRSYEGSRLLMPMLMLILGFYFGEKTARRKR